MYSDLICYLKYTFSVACMMLGGFVSTPKNRKKQSVVKVKFGKWGNTQSVLAAQCG